MKGFSEDWNAGALRFSHCIAEALHCAEVTQGAQRPGRTAFGGSLALSGFGHYATWLLVACMLAGLGACTKEVDDLSFPETPTIRLVAQSHTELVGFADTLLLTLAYEDGDGDLGGVDSESWVYVQDRRLTRPDRFAFGRLNAEDGQRSIQGELVIALGPYFSLSNAAEEPLELEIWLTDRAGNISNRISPATITIRQP